MDKLVHVPDEAEHEQEYGNFNQYPPHWKELTEQEFARSQFFSYSFEKMEYRQMLRDMDGTEREYLSAKLFFFHDKTGVAMHSNYNTGKVHYYRFGCVHQWTKPSEALLKEKKHWPLARTETAALCQACGTLRFTDSSD